MFGVDFSELMVVMVIGLIVIGPERLPKVARTLGMLWGRAQRYINGVKADLARDMAAEELRQLHLKVQQEAREAEIAIQQSADAVDQQVRELNSAVAQSIPVASDKSAPAPELPPASGQEKNSDKQ